MTMQDPAAEAFYSLVRWLPHNELTGIRDIAGIQGEHEDITIEEWRQIVGDNFPELLHGAETCLSVVCQLLISDVHNCFALFLIDAASSGKTIILNFFAGLEEIIYSTDHLSSASFVSSIAGKSEKQLMKIDLLPKIRYKVLLIREMASLFADDEATLKEIIQKLTRILDGEGYTTESGVYGQRGYQGDYVFMMLGASTPFAPRVWRATTEVGHRFFFYNLRSPDYSEDELLEMVRGSNFKAKQVLCQRATHRMLKTLWKRHADGVEWDMQGDSEEALRWISRLARFLCLFRADIFATTEWDDDGRSVEVSKPKIEKPPRAMTCLTNLARGHSIADGRTNVTMDDLWPIVRSVLSSAPDPRPDILLGLLRNNGQLNIQELCAAAKISRNTAKKEMQKLIRLGICVGHLEKSKEEIEEDHGLGGVVQEIHSGHSKWWIKLAPEWEWWTGEVMTGILEANGIIK